MCSTRPQKTRQSNKYYSRRQDHWKLRRSKHLGSTNEYSTLQNCLKRGCKYPFHDLKVALRKYIKAIKRTTALFLIRQVSICSFSGCTRVNWGQAPFLKHPIHSLFASQGSHMSHVELPSCQVSHQGASWQRAPCT